MPLFAFASPGLQIGTLAVTLQVVPEPGVLLVLASGLAGLAGTAWRARRKHFVGE